MNFTKWVNSNKANFGSEFELLFAETVLPRVPELHIEAITVQYPFKDLDRNQRYCDFVIQEGDAVRIAIALLHKSTGCDPGQSHLN